MQGFGDLFLGRGTDKLSEPGFLGFLGLAGFLGCHKSHKSFNPFNPGSEYGRCACPSQVQKYLTQGYGRTATAPTLPSKDK
jgi:hypothetical protein